MKKLLFGILLLSTITGCQPAQITSVMRGSDNNGSMMTRCESSDLRDVQEMKEVMSRYDGWRMIYVSEFTTGNRFGTVGVVCFERPNK